MLVWDNVGEVTAKLRDFNITLQFFYLYWNYQLINMNNNALLWIDFFAQTMQVIFPTNNRPHYFFAPLSLKVIAYSHSQLTFRIELLHSVVHVHYHHLFSVHEPGIFCGRPFKSYWPQCTKKKKKSGKSLRKLSGNRPPLDTPIQ